MTVIENIHIPPTNNTDTEGDSESYWVCSIIFKNNKYSVVGRKFGTYSIYWEIEGLGFIITSKNSPIVFSNNELYTTEIHQTFTMWNTVGISIIN